MNNQTTDARRATRAIFLICGLAVASWAIMVPYAKERLNLNDANLGLLLLLLGGGAITMMPVSGILAHRYGSRIVILCSALVMATMLPLLLIMTSTIWMAVVLFIFGAAVGTVDVAMNSHGVQVQNQSGKAIMSSLHGLFSIGGLLGSLGLGFLMKFGLSPVTASVTISLLLIAIVSWKYQFLFDSKTEKKIISEFASENHETKSRSFSWLKASVIFLGFMCFSAFLVEGAMLDWSAIFLKENKGVAVELAGIGYAAFSVAMATMRLLGDRIVTRLNGRTVVVGGGLIAAAGLFIAILTPWVITSLLGFILLGIGSANIVPVFFSEAGRLKNVSASVAIPVISTMGYAGQLAGPALLGFIAYHSSLPWALGFSALLVLTVAIAYLFKKNLKTESSPSK